MLHGCIGCPRAVSRFVLEHQATGLRCVPLEYVDRILCAATWIVVLNPVMMDAYLHGADVDELGGV